MIVLFKMKGGRTLHSTTFLLYHYEP